MSGELSEKKVTVLSLDSAEQFSLESKSDWFTQLRHTIGLKISRHFFIH